MKQKALQVIYFITYWIGINKLFYSINKKKQIILTYHNIIPEKYFDNSLPHLGVSHTTSVFDFQIEFISSKLKFTTDLGVPRSCIVTFDDGFLNNYTEAHKVLKKYGVNAIFFVPLDLLQNGNILWIDKILLWISYVPKGTYRILELDITIDNKNSRLKSFGKIWSFLLENYDKKQDFLENMENSFPLYSLKIDSNLYAIRFTSMSLDQIDEMKDYGHKIGSHSFYHDILSLLDDESLDEEIKLCESELGKLYNTTIFSYPFGGKNEVSKSVIERLTKSKFTSAVVNISDPEFEYGKYAIPRLSLPNTTNKYKIDAILCGLEHFLKYRRFLPNIKDLV